MKVDTMRKIDFYVGIPLTFLVSIVVRFFDIFRRKPSNKKILFIELSEMGSTVLADPAMRKIRDHSSAALYFVIFSKNRMSLDLLKTIPDENIFVLRDNTLFLLLWDAWRYLWWCRRQKFYATVDLELFSRVSALLSGCSGAIHRVGFYKFYNEGLYRGNMLTHRVSYNPHMHISKNFIALVNALISPDKEIPYSKTKITDDEVILPIIESTEAGKIAIYQKIKAISPDFLHEKNKIILINPNASDLLPQRRWMPSYFESVIRKMIADFPDHYVLITGAPAEYTQAQLLCDAVSHVRCINFAGQTKFTQLIDLYNVSKIMLTNDSGPGHFSAVTSLKTFVIFGPETPALYGSLGNSTPIYAGLACSPCVSASNHRKTACQDNVCLKVLTPEIVYHIVKQSL
ncbi:MAG: glycosyltransferase family 9 protein [Coxiellaceae bacterium]|nr:glycosyltransferase family 9 protein [Coxiellaceae bacterium]